MQYSDTSLKGGIVQDIDYLINTDSTNYPLADKARNINRRYDEVVSLILQSDGRWKWDDTNNSSQPTGTITLTEGTTAYAIPDTTYLTINRMEVKDVNGNYYKIRPIHEREIRQGLTEFQKTAGRPLYYEKVGGFVNLYPKPSSSAATLTAGLKIYYTRDASYFVAGDTTKVPGFAAPFHRILSIGAALDYAIANELMGKISILQPMLTKMESDMIQFYSTRDRDEQLNLDVRTESYGDYGGYSGGGCSDKVAFY
jgi:hypothetical protein